MSEELAMLPQRSIGGIVVKCTVREVSTDTAQATKHPIQGGANVSDHIILEDSTLEIEVADDDEEEPITEKYQKFLRLQADRAPFSVVTSKRIYQNMYVSGLIQTTDSETESILSLIVQLEGIRFANMKTTSIPEQPRQSLPKKTTSTADTGKRQAEPAPNMSVLSGLFGG